MIVIDTNLLLLLLVGMTRPAYVAKHKRLAAYRIEDFDLLVEVCQCDDLLLIPNTLSEASNLLVQGVMPPLRDELRRTLARVIDTTTESYVASRTTTHDQYFRELGLTDSALLQACADGAQLLTVDVKLYQIAFSRGLTVENFNHRRNFDL